MDIALITYPIETNPAGVGVFVENIVKNILKLDNKNTYYLLHFKKSDNSLYRGNEILYRHYPFFPTMFSDSWHLFRQPERFDIIHRFLPGGFLLRVPSKIVLTVHDLFFYNLYPFNRKRSVLLARFFNKISMLKADAITADSHFTRQEILKTFPIEKEKVHVIYGALRDMNIQPPASAMRLLSTYGVNAPYILFVSTIEPRKNLLTLIKAFEILKQRHDVKENLVVVGKEGWDYRETLRYMDASKYRFCIQRIGYVPTSDLSCFYQEASVFVYPSFMEGFGLPPLEAMACGCPVLTSNTSSLPEVVADPEMMFHPENVEELVDKILNLLIHPVYRKTNIEKGFKNVARFSWRKSAERIIDIYDRLGPLSR